MFPDHIPVLSVSQHERRSRLRLPISLLTLDLRLVDSISYFVSECPEGV